jgi:hypothetical protein
MTILALAWVSLACEAKEAEMKQVKPVIEKQLSDLGQAPKEAAAGDVAKIAKPFEGYPALHYLIKVSNADAALSVYYLGDDSAKNMDAIKRLGDECAKERSSGLNVAFQSIGVDKRTFFAHLASKDAGAGLEDFLAHIFTPGAASRMRSALK